MHGRGPSNINPAALLSPLKFAGFHNQFPQLTMLGNVFLVKSPEILTNQNIQRQNENEKLTFVKSE